MWLLTIFFFPGSSFVVLLQVAAFASAAVGFAVAAGMSQLVASRIAFTVSVAALSFVPPSAQRAVSELLPVPSSFSFSFSSASFLIFLSPLFGGAVVRRGTPSGCERDPHGCQVVSHHAGLVQLPAPGVGHQHLVYEVGQLTNVVLLVGKSSVAIFDLF